MVNWKNVLITIVPIATTLLGSSVLLTFWNNIEQSFNQPIINFHNEPSTDFNYPNSGYKSSYFNVDNPIRSFYSIVSNDGHRNALALNITINYPKVKNVSVEVLPPAIGFEITKETVKYTQSSFQQSNKSINNITQFRITTPIFPAEDKITLRTTANISRGEAFVPSEIDCSVLISYNVKIHNIDGNDDIENIVKKGQCNESHVFIGNPYILSNWTPIIILLIVVGFLSIIIIIKMPQYIKQRKNEHNKRKIINNIRNEVYNIKNTLEEKDKLKTLIEDKVWNTIPFDTKFGIINNVDDFMLLEKFFNLIMERNSILFANESKFNNGKISNSNLDSIRHDILSTSQEIIEIKWQRYYYKNREKGHNSLFLIIPLIAIFSITMTYGIEATLSYFFIGSNYSEFIDSWLSVTSSNKYYTNHLNLIEFFVFSLIGRSIVSFLMIKFILNKFRHLFFNDLEPHDTIDNTSYSNNPKVKLIAISIGINGTPSLLLSLIIVTLTSSGIPFDNPTVRSIIAIMIPLLDLARLAISLIIIRTHNNVKTLYVSAAALTLLSGSLYIGLISKLSDLAKIIPAGPPYWIFTSELVAIAIMQIAWILPMIKRKGYEYCTLGVIGYTFLSITWIIILVDVPHVLGYFNELPLSDNPIYYRLNTIEEIYPVISLIGSAIVIIQITYILIVSIIMTKQKDIKNMNHLSFIKGSK
jgi:hypothetical protein